MIDGIDLERARETLYSAVLADILDDMGHRHQVMHANIRPVCHERVVVGTASTMLATPRCEEPAEPFATQIQAVDALREGDVVVAQMSGITDAAFWGELFSTAAKQRGAVGAIMDGYARDTRKVIELGFPLFATGIRPINSKGRLVVEHHNQPIRCGGVKVKPGDVVFAEIDGIVVVPQEIAQEVFARAFAVAQKENLMRHDLENGMLLGEAWRKHRVL